MLLPVEEWVEGAVVTLSAQHCVCVCVHARVFTVRSSVSLPCTQPVGYWVIGASNC